MNVVAIDAVPYALPFRDAYVSARGRLERRELVLVRMQTDEGVEGLGEAVPLSLRGGAGIAEVEREIREAGRAMSGSRLGGDEPLARHPAEAALSPPAAAAIELARLDLAAKLQGQPAWRLLGATSAEPISCNATLVAGPPPAVAADAERWAGLGFSTFKLKVGVSGDVGQVETVRAALGPGAKIRVDANGTWSPSEAVLRLTAMERHGIELAEQPAADLEDLAAVRGQTAVPIAADESVANPADARRAVELGACQLATVKLPKVGGTDAARSIAATLPTYLSSALDVPVGIAGAAHLAAALPREGPARGLAQGLATQLLFAETIAASQCELRDGLLHLPEGPGLGVEIDDAALERHRL